MGQDFHVLRCYSCQTFQVQQVKKATRWSCKVCGEKQSVFKEFVRGTAADCRRHVQKLNAKRGEMEQELVTWSLREKDEEAGQSFGGGARTADGHNERRSDAELVSQCCAEESRWDKYLLNTPQEGEEPGEEPEDTSYLSRSNLHGNGNARKRKRAVDRADRDDGSFTEELPALPISKSYTAQHSVSISSSFNQTRPGVTRRTINTDCNQANPGVTRGTINTDCNQANPGVTRGTINTDCNQANPGVTRGTINTDCNQANPGVTRGPINTDCNQANPGVTRGTINTDCNQANPGVTRVTITKEDYNQTRSGFTMATVTTESNQTKPDFIRHVSNFGLDRVPLGNKSCSVGSSAAPPISRWTQFLPIPHPQAEEEEEEEDGDDEEKSRLLHNMESKSLDRLGSSATPCGLGNVRELGHQSEVPKAVLSQTTHPYNQPCPSLPINSLFNTGDDFDAFNFDDMF